MKYVLVSTYPKEGTQNIGDKLIEQSTADAIRSYDRAAEIAIVWRAETWGAVRDIVAEADHVVFACLAIRKNMQAVYPYIEDILNLEVPVSVIAAGTSLQVMSRDMFNQGFTSTDIDLLKRISNIAQVFTTRGALSQAFCVHHGLDRATLSGDVAFFDPRYDGRQFEQPDRIERIVVSDPHYGEVYVPVFRALVDQLRNLFPMAQIDCVLHGVNPPIESACAEIGMTSWPIYREPATGLEIYENYDMHAGFRVHGHVSALKRRNPSYLLEQDGRGTDYGLTFSRKVTVPCYRTAQPSAEGPASSGPARSSLIERVRKSLFPPPAPAKKATRFVASPAAAALLGSLISQDTADGFLRFQGLESDITGFNARTRAAMESICTGKRQ